MAKYVDGFVLPIPKRKRDEYKKLAKKAGKIWMEHGALEYYECMGDDIPPGKQTSFAKSVKLKKNEVVWFSWIVYKSRSERDRILKKVMSDPRIKAMGEPSDMPFDAKRMLFGGFKPEVVY